MKTLSAEEREFLEKSRQNAFVLDRMHKNGELEDADLLDSVPGLIHLNSKDDLHITHLNKDAESLLGRSSEDIREMGLEFFEYFLHPETIERAFPHFFKFYADNDTDAVCGEFQYVKIRGKWTLIYTCAKIQKHSEKFLCISFPVKNLGASSKKLERLLGEHLFVRKNLRKFEQLTKREKTVLAKIGAGQSNKEIGEELFISIHTVKTHRKRIKKKLEARNLAEMIRYALSFGLLDDNF